MEDNWQETRDQYRNAVVHFLNRYNEQVSEHVIDVMISVMMTRDNVLQGGSFVQSVVSNNLREAISRADADCTKNLRIITLCANFCYAEHEMNV
jgi:citrate lyase synthetase